MYTVPNYRAHARECRKIAQSMSRPEDRETMEAIAKVWEAVAFDRERYLRAVSSPGPIATSSHPDLASGSLESSSLTQRERQVAELVPLGLSNKEIARELSVAPGTIKIHLHRIFEKLAVRNRTALAMRKAPQITQKRP